MTPRSPYTPAYIYRNFHDRVTVRFRPTRPWKTSPPLTRRRLRQQVKHMLRQHHQPAWQRLLARCAGTLWSPELLRQFYDATYYRVRICEKGYNDEPAEG